MTKSYSATLGLAATWVSAFAGAVLCWSGFGLPASAHKHAHKQLMLDPASSDRAKSRSSEGAGKASQLIKPDLIPMPEIRRGETRDLRAKDFQQASLTHAAANEIPSGDLDSRVGVPETSSNGPTNPGIAPYQRRQESTLQTVEDPADQVAPPGLNIELGNYPINPYLSLAMQQELDNLVGRFESALFRAASADPEAGLGVGFLAPTLRASAAASDVGGLAGEIFLHPVLAEAQKLILDWPELIQQRSYGEARQRWLAVRQALWDNFPIDQPVAQPEIRAIWLDRGAIVQAGSRQQLAEIFDRLAEAGINTVFFETVNAGYPIYPSRVAPQQNPLTRHWDPLRVAVDLAHERNIELHAWIWVFAAGNQLHNTILNLPADYPGPLLNAHPEWAAYDHLGNMIPRGQTKPFLDPANPEVRNYLLRLLSEMVNNYDLDGIQLDYIRYPFQDPGANRTYGYGVAARRQFMQMTGVDPITLSPRTDPFQPLAEQRRQQHLWERWTEFRIQQVNDFVAEASQVVKRQHPDVVVSAAVFAHSEHDRLQKLQQDWGTWAERGDIDWIVLMSYASDTNRLEQLVHPWLVENDYGSTLVLPGIRLLNLSQSATIDQVQALRDLPTGGYALFAAANLTSGLQTILSRTQGQSTGESSGLIPQREPFQVASTRFQALQQEWDWLMENQQLWMDQNNLERWKTEIASLEQQLINLANEPSATRLAQTRSSLSQLQTMIGEGFIDIRAASSRDYRLRSWRNRLITIERLLTYGEHRLL
ncbi:MAG: family 10 glycosylhydrolase [Leptolyngbyaceae cyanobacterium MO_188.B28]|nr:family 10 glycosylhydrolase [Leptolyngbyaceae cyanobacterium MO_188.B28]